MLEVWIGTENDKIMLPVTPSKIGVDRSVDMSVENVINFGEVDFCNGTKLKTMELEGFFPHQDYSFSKKKMQPYEYYYKLDKWKVDKTIVRVIVTNTPINMLCRIVKFNTDEHDGTRDLYFELSLQEHREIEIPRIGQPPQASNPRPIPPNKKANKNTQKTYKVVKGDCLWNISKKFYGKGSVYKKINEANKDKYPSLAKNNVIYPNWVLVIP